MDWLGVYIGPKYNRNVYVRTSARICILIGYITCQSKLGHLHTVCRSQSSMIIE